VSSRQKNQSHSYPLYKTNTIFQINNRHNSPNRFLFVLCFWFQIWVSQGIGHNFTLLTTKQLNTMRKKYYFYMVAFLVYLKPINAEHHSYGNLLQTTNCTTFSTFCYHNCPNDDPKCDGRIEYENGDVYEGEISFGEPHGKGKFVWADGSVYEGQFVNGLREGWGTQILDDGSSYEGNWKKGYMEGFGHYTFSCGHNYSGTFSMDEMHGMGTLEKSNGETYAGEWKHSEADGEGTYTFLDGSKFVGHYTQGKRNGGGMLAWMSGEIMEANWENDKLNGSAEIKFRNGDSFVCQFIDGVQEGESNYTFKNGKVIEGDVAFIELMMMKESTTLAAAIEPNLGFASYAMAMEYKKIKQFDLAEKNFKQAQAFLPEKSELADRIPHQMASLKEDRRVN
jgi:hypothetical protein